MSEQNKNYQVASTQHITASAGATIKEVIQAIISGEVMGDVHIGDKIYTRSELEELRDYLGQGVSRYAAQMGRNVRLTRRKLPETPYRSLEYFDLAHKAIFFGREEAVQKFLAQIKPDNKRLTLLHAPSGAGKTSFIRAGLEPALWNEEEVVLYARAFTSPTEALKQLIVSVAGPGPDLAHLSLYEFLQWFRLSLIDGQRLIIFLDQFEEFFIHLDEITRTNFIEQLGRCLEDSHLPLRFILSLRKDYLAEMEAFKERILGIFHNTFLLPPLTREQATAAITKPAELYGITWAPAVTEALLSYLAQGEIAPPHLQLICTRLYERAVERSAKQITPYHLDELGGLVAIHKDYLVNEMQALCGPQGLTEREEVGWHLLKNLVTTAGTKVPRTPDYLREHIEADPELLTEVISILVQRRILRKDNTPQGETIVEIAHDTLAAEICTRQSPREVRVKLALELIERELLSHRAHQTLVSLERLQILDEFHTDLPDINPEATVFLLRSAVAANYKVQLWYERAAAKVKPELLGNIYSLLAEFLLFKLHILKQKEAIFGGEPPLNLVREVKATGETFNLLTREFAKIRDGKAKNSLETAEVFPRTASTDLTPKNSNSVETVRVFPDKNAVEQWLLLQEQRCQFLFTEIPMELETQIWALRQNISNSLAQANSEARETFTEIHRDFTIEALSSLDRQFASLLRLEEELSERRARFGGFYIPLSLLNNLTDLKERQFKIAFERWDMYEQPSPSFRGFEAELISDKVKELLQFKKEGKWTSEEAKTDYEYLVGLLRYYHFEFLLQIKGLI